MFRGEGDILGNIDVVGVGHELLQNLRRLERGDRVGYVSGIRGNSHESVLGQRDGRPLVGTDGMQPLVLYVYGGSHKYIIIIMMR
jgi:hypothetical protein